jgi:hypothetical protein
VFQWHTPHSVLSCKLANVHVPAKRVHHTLNDSIDWTTLLAKAAVDALCHVNVISCCPPATIFSLLGLNCDSLSWANGLAELAGNTSFLAGGVSPQSVFASETRRDGPLFERIKDGIAVSIL